MNKLTENLLNLIRENPELPVIPMVDYNVFGDGDGYDRAFAKFGNAYVGKYIIYNGGEKPVYIKDRFGDEIKLKEEIYNNHKDYFAGMTREEIYDKLEAIVAPMWTPAIIVCIDPLGEV